MNESVVYPGSSEVFNQKSGDKNWMTLSDVLKVKKIADNINFMRHFFLKSTSNYLLRRKVNFSQGKQESTQICSLEIIDCVVAIFLFELTRTFKLGHSDYLYSKDQFQFKILHFFSTLRRAEEIEVKLDAENDTDEGSDALDELLDSLHLDQQKNACVNCKLVTKNNTNFSVLYKTLVENILSNL